MEFDRSPDSDVTSDDLPPAQQNKGVTGGNVTGNGCIHCAKMKTDTEIQIHQLEIEDCDSILRAIEADSEAFTWISPEDLRWEVEDSGSIDGSAQGAPDCRITESASHDDAVLDTEWRNGPVKKKSKKVFAPSQNDTINKRAHTIEILHTRSLVNEIKKVFGAKNPDPRKIEKAQKLMKEHEQSLIETIKLLDDDTSDGDSGSVTSDDLPPAQQNKGVTGGNVTGNGCIHCAKMKTDTEIQIHQLEIEDCDSILRAIEADSEAFTW